MLRTSHHPRNHFLASVLRGEPLFVIEDQKDLAKLTCGATDKTHQPSMKELDDEMERYVT